MSCGVQVSPERRPSAAGEGDRENRTVKADEVEILRAPEESGHHTRIPMPKPRPPR